MRDRKAKKTVKNGIQSALKIHNSTPRSHTAVSKPTSRGGFQRSISRSRERHSREKKIDVEFRTKSLEHGSRELLVMSRSKLDSTHVRRRLINDIDEKFREQNRRKDFYLVFKQCLDELEDVNTRFEPFGQ